MGHESPYADRDDPSSNSQSLYADGSLPSCNRWGGGERSALERMRDLRAEIATEEAHAKAASCMAAFLSTLHPDVTATLQPDVVLAAALASTADFVKPIIDA